jgi:hypothetical protein
MKYLIISLFFLISGCTTYKFGVQESEYPLYFAESENNLNRVFKYNESYSWHTELLMGTELIKVEHGVIASDKDIKKLGIPDGNYIFSSIEFGSGNTQRAEVTLSSQGKPLKLVGTYIFSSDRDENCKITKPNSRWKIDKLDGTEINEKCGFGLINIYQVPTENSISSFTAKYLWFRDNIKETIDIENNEKSYKYNFNLVWHKSSSVWWEISTIT